MKGDFKMKKKIEFGVALKEKTGAEGLSRSEVLDLFDLLSNTQAFPIELEARAQECSTMGFIDPDYAELLDFDYESSGFHDFIAAILDNMELEQEDGIYQYEYKGATIPVYLSR
jgi:hypothetical protein